MTWWTWRSPTTPGTPRGVLLNIHLNSEGEIEELRDAFVPGALETLTVGEGDDVKTIPGYTQVDSIRKFYGGGPSMILR